MTYRVTLLPGDGIGPEITAATVRVLEATGVKFEWDTFTVGEAAIEKYGNGETLEPRLVNIDRVFTKENAAEYMPEAY